MTSFVFMWEDQNGERRWEADRERQTRGFMEKLLNEGVPPATVMIAYAPILFHWVWPQFHEGLSDVNFHAINEEIYGTGAAPEKKRDPVNVPMEKEKPDVKYGWISPDGRFFSCGYGGHTNLARKIVGDLQYIPDPERHLEDLGWVKIFSGTAFRERYAVGSGIGKKVTPEQLKMINRLGLENAYGLSDLL